MTDSMELLERLVDCVRLAIEDGKISPTSYVGVAWRDYVERYRFKSVTDEVQTIFEATGNPLVPKVSMHWTNDLSVRLRNEKSNGYVYSVSEKRKLNELLEEAAREIEQMVDELTEMVEAEQASQPAPAPEDGELICPFCQSQNRLMHPHHVTSMGAVCAASGLPHFEAVKLAKSLPVMDSKEPRQ